MNFVKVRYIYVVIDSQLYVNFTLLGRSDTLFFNQYLYTFNNYLVILNLFSSLYIDGLSFSRISTNLYFL